MRLTIRDIRQMKKRGEKIVMMTAYDATSARLSEAAGINVLLVGDTLGMVVQGHESTIPVKIEDMIYHTAIVERVTEKAFIVADMPFMTYQVSEEQAMTNAARLMQEGGASAVKLEGGARMAATIERIVSSGIPVMAHIGLTPQSVNQFGGFRVQGKELDSARRLLEDARAVQAAGAFAVVLELVPDRLAGLITEALKIPTIGIGAGVDCDGQVQVFHDVLALFEDFIPRHTKRYADVGAQIRDALTNYREEVEGKTFPDSDHAFSIDDTIYETLLKEVKSQ